MSKESRSIAPVGVYFAFVAGSLAIHLLSGRTVPLVIDPTALLLIGTGVYIATWFVCMLRRKRA